jgi:hypothetical protein
MELSPCYKKRGDNQGKNAENYRAGGARGEVARGTAEDTKTTKGATSRRFVTGTKAKLADCAATIEPVVEQTGQICEADGVVVKSVQKWNCAPRKKTPRSNAKMRMR